jgi:hypothetical protein
VLGVRARERRTHRDWPPGGDVFQRNVRMTMSKGTKRARVLVVAGLAVIAGALGVGLSLAFSGSQTGILTGELRLVEGGPAGETVISWSGDGGRCWTSRRGTPSL